LWLAPLRLAFAFLFITLVTTILDTKGSLVDPIFKSRVGRKYILFYLIMILGVPFAYYRYLAFSSVLEYANNLLFLFFCLILINTIEKLKAMIFTICFSALFYGALSLALSETGIERLEYGAMFDPNDLAYILVSLIPLSIHYVTQNNSSIKRIFGIVTVSVSLVTILLTGSRGGMLGLISILVILFFTKVSGITWSKKITLLIIAFALFATFGSSINMDRYKTLETMGSDYNMTDEEGRIALWRAGIQIALSNPFTGVGVNCIPNAIGEMRAAQDASTRKWQTVHNSYIEIAAEIGLIGFIVFSSMIIGTFKEFTLSRKVQITSPHAKEFQSIAAALQIGFIGSLVTAFFLSQAYSIIFTLFFALSAVMKNIAISQSVQPLRH
jgi:O-antigen ligase